MGRARHRYPPPGARGKIFRLLCEHPYGLSNAQICDFLYGWRIDGGPDDAANVVGMQIYFLNKDLRKGGLWLRVKSLCRSGRKYLLVLQRPNKELDEHEQVWEKYWESRESHARIQARNVALWLQERPEGKVPRAGNRDRNV